MEIIWYTITLIIWILLWLTGGGGSILAVPLFVYIFGIHPEYATSYSLGIVWITSLFALRPKYKAWQVDIRTGLIFGIPSLAWVTIVRSIIMPLIPNIISVWWFTLTKSALIMIVFAIIMLMAAWSMLKKSKENHTTAKEMNLWIKYFLIAGEGLIVWGITGFVGAGGGFLIIPALLYLTKLPIKQAIGTSLLIIAIKSLLGFASDLGHISIDITLLSIASVLSIAGMFFWNFLQSYINDSVLKKYFWYMIIVMWILILIKEFI